MPVVVCSSCQVKINVKDEMLGKKAKCPKCAATIVLQAAAAAPAKPAARSAAPAVSPVQSKAPAAKAKSAPPPLPAEEVGDEFEEVDEPRKRPKPKRPLDDDDFDDEPRAKKRRREDDDDDEPRATKRRGRDSEDDEDDDFDDDRGARGSRRRPKRSRGGWAGARSGLQLAFCAAIVVAVGYTLLQIVSIFGPAAAFAGPRGFQQGPNAGGASIVGILAILLFLVIFIAEVTHVVGQCFCISAPAPTASSRAKFSVIFLGSAIVIALVGFCLVAVLGIGTAVNLAQQAQQNPQNQRAIAGDAFAGAMGIGIAGMLVGLVAGGLTIASGVFWVLFHSAVADALRDRALQTQCHIFLAVAIIAPLVNWGMSFALLSLGGPGSFRMMFIMSNLLSAAVFVGLTVWYVLINRRVVRLLDVQGG